MTEKTKKYWADIFIAIELIEEFSQNITDFFEYQKDLKTKSAVERQLGIIGEAVNQLKRVDNKVELNNARQIVDFRNRLIHSYDNLDDAIVWAIIKKHIPILKIEVTKILKED